jgi:outer membrane protein TolC
MVPASLTILRRFSQTARRLACWSATGLPLVGLACAQFGDHVAPLAPSVVRAAPAELPPSAPTPPEPAQKPGMLAINLDTVLRLAEERNARIAGARTRVEEAFAAQDLAAKSWLPIVNIGPSYFRHEGGISNETGTLTRSSWSSLFGGLELNGKLNLREAVYLRVNAERQVWQQKGELRQITTETLLDAATTYIDLLAARTGEAVAQDIQQDLQKLLDRTMRLAKVDRAADVEVARIQSHLKGSQRILLELREQGDRAAAKLSYLLGVDPMLKLVPVDARLAPLHLVQADQPVETLVGQALASGPGVHELEGLLNLVRESVEKSQSSARFLPELEMRVLEGGFGTGPGDNLTWDNRLDIGLQARWNLTDLFTASERRRVLQAKVDQAHWAYQDLRGKLTAGVQESRAAILYGRDQIKLAQEQVQEAQRAHHLSQQRLENSVPGSSASEVLLSLQAVSSAQIGYISTLRAYDQAQLRLLVVLGQVSPALAEDGGCSNGCGKAQ